MAVAIACALPKPPAPIIEKNVYESLFTYSCYSIVNLPKFPSESNIPGSHNVTTLARVNAKKTLQVFAI